MPGWEAFDMVGVSAWPLPIVVPQGVALNVVVFEVTTVTESVDS